MKICDIEAYFQSIYPKERSSSWDNDGLLVCRDREKSVKKILTCLDVTFSAIEKASSEGCDLIVSHHPLIFSPIKALNEDSIVGQKILLLLRSDLSLISLHTRFDGAVGGLNDRFGELLGITTRGHGPLLNEEPYIGGIGFLEGKMSPEKFALRVSRVLNAPVKLYSAGFDVERVGFCCGAGKDLVKPSLEQGADAFVGGDISYHVAQEAVEKGMTVIDCGHYASEKDAAFCFEKALVAFSPDLEIIPFVEPLGGEIIDSSHDFCSNSTT